MASLGIKDAFARYSAKLHNVQWSVSAWAPDGSLIVSLWEHHRRPSKPGTLEFAESANRWKGPGNNEFRENLSKAFKINANVRLVIVRTEEKFRVENGEDASSISKTYALREDLIGKLIEWNGEMYAFSFTKA